MEILIGALVIAVFFTAVIALLRGERAWSGLTFFFLLFFLPLWALALWVPAVGPIWYGIAWLDLMVIATLLTVLLSATSSRSDYRNKLMSTREPANSDQHSTTMSRYSAAYWAFVILMIVAILFGTARSGFAAAGVTEIRQQQIEPAQPQTAVFVTTVKVAQGSGCWATLYDRNHFTGEQITVVDGVDLPEMNFDENQNWRGRVESIRVGPKAQLTLYGEPFWSDKDYVVKPGEQIAIMSNLPWDYVESLKLKCLPGGR